MPVRKNKASEPLQPLTISVRDMSAVSQYLDWALITVQTALNPDCEEVHIVVDIKNRQTRTSGLITGKRGKKEFKPLKINLREATVLRDLCNRQIGDLEGKMDKCAGSLYPGIFGNQITEIKALFEKMTGFPLGDKND